MKPLHLVLLLAMNCCWGITSTTFKILAPWLDAGGVTTMRFGLSAIILLLCWPWLPGKAPRRQDLIRAIAMGIIVFVGAPRLQVAGVQIGRAGDCSVLMALEPLVTSVAAAIFLREHIGTQRWAGFALGLAGAVFMAEVWRPEFRLPDLNANVLIVLSFFCECAYSIMGKPILEKAGLFKLMAVSLTAGTVVNLLVDGSHTFHEISTLPPSGWLLLAYLSLICPVVGYALWYVVIREAQVNVAALTIFAQPVVGVAAAVLWLGESLRWGQLWGSLVIVAGLVIGLWRRPKPRPT